MKMLLVTVLLGTLLVGRVVNQDTTVKDKTGEDKETSTIKMDTDEEEVTTTVSFDTKQEEDTRTITVDTLQGETEEEDLREQCLYKQKRPGFTCDSGECIDRGGVCDKHQDCTDGSDETISCCSSTCTTTTMGSVCIPSDGYNHTVTDCRTCSKSGYSGYRCDDGACIYRRKLCDGRSQCKDDSDEKYCAFHLCQTEQGVLVNVPRDMLDNTGDCRRCDYHSEGDGFRCNNARCILGAWKCDGAADCSDGSDETDQLCKPLAGQEEERQPQLGPAVSTNKAETVASMEQISSASGLTSGGNVEDKTGEEEDTSTIKINTNEEEVRTTVSVDTKQEKDRKTITVDTLQGETEEEDLREQCLYKQKRPGFTCDSGECIDRGDVCDKHQDCTDGSDETISCCSSTCTTSTMGTVCIPSDGYNHTVTDCRTCSKSGYSGYRCDDGACIYRRKLCDGRSQCKDDSDEKYCAFHLCQTEQGALVNVPRDMLDKTGDCRRCDYHSEGDGFRCNNARCILGAWKCDGTADCSDGSDETDQLCKPLAGQEEERQPQLGPAVSTNKAETVASMEQISSGSGPKSGGNIQNWCWLLIVGIVYQNLVPALLAGSSSSTAIVLSLTAMWSEVDSLLTLGALPTISPGCVVIHRASSVAMDLN